MQYKDLETLLEKEEIRQDKIYKRTSFDWVLDLLRDNMIHSYDGCSNEKDCDDADNGKKWIAFTSRPSSDFHMSQPEYGPCEIMIDRQLLKSLNKVYNVQFTPEWLDKYPSICKFISKGKYDSSVDYFRKNFDKIDWRNRDEYSLRFFKPYLSDTDVLDVEALLSGMSNDVSKIEDYIYASNYIPFASYLRILGGNEDIIIAESPLKLVNDAILSLVIPRRYKDKIAHHEGDYKIRYE